MSFNIKGDYKARDKVWDDSIELYWGSDRIKRAYAIEKKVYEFAENKLKKINKDKIKVLDVGCGYAYKWYLV